MPYRHRLRNRIGHWQSSTTFFIATRPALFNECYVVSYSSGAGPSADAAAAIEAGLLPCLSHLVDRMGSGDYMGTVWRPPTIFPGVDACLADVLQFGPLGQVGELVSALGRRLRGAVEELRAAAAMQGGVAEEDGGERAWWIAAVACQAMLHAKICLCALALRWQEAAPTVAAGIGAQEAAAYGAGQCDSLGRAAQCPVRASLALSELLPVLSASVQVYCGDSVQSVRGRGGGAGRRRGGGSRGGAG